MIRYLIREIDHLGEGPEVFGPIHTELVCVGRYAAGWTRRIRPLVQQGENTRTPIPTTIGTTPNGQCIMDMYYLQFRRSHH